MSLKSTPIQPVPEATARVATGAGTPPSAVAQAPDRECRLVDVDPWAVLLEQLMEVPDERTPVKRERGEGG